MLQCKKAHSVTTFSSTSSIGSCPRANLLLLTEPAKVTANAPGIIYQTFFHTPGINMYFAVSSSLGRHPRAWACLGVFALPSNERHVIVARILYASQGIYSIVASTYRILRGPSVL
ncbi:hypothetical protein OG21DRAFT_1208892 [Imleria badia]|nr:hypothetical protein OG21DRAFT_1208892 [Imleria badia]